MYAQNTHRNAATLMEPRFPGLLASTWLARSGPEYRVADGCTVTAEIETPLPATDSRAALILRVAQAADRQAFGELFAHFAPRVKSYLRRLGAPEIVAEDLAQETMLALWRKAALFDPARAGAATWVFTIARNLRIDALRRDRPTEALPADYEHEAADNQLPADAALVVDERDARLRAALEKLPPEQVQLVQLAFYQDKPHREIERQLGIPLGTVKSRLRMAMQRLRAALED
jgi:RNA polymerase sigma-70 factor (ECF subfamily)